MIATEFLVDDLLSSIATNGFFGGEPLIVEAAGDQFTVLEGNRRLAALLILADDSRASEQKRRGDVFRARMEENNKTVPQQIPVVIVNGSDEANQALAYLGTKHIVGAKQWDSYAKAKWMAEMREATEFSLTQIKQMIGDTGGLVNRMLEGYYVVEQLREDARFDPGQSYVRGRGSNPEFPFSWVYSALSLSGIRKFTGLEEGEPIAKPVPADSIQNAADLMEMMFGNRQLSKPPVIKESRNLGELAKALLDVSQSAKLREGKDLKAVQEESVPLAEQMLLLIQESNERMSKAFGVLGRSNVGEEEINALNDPSKQALTIASSFRKEIRDRIATFEEGSIEI